MNVNYTRKINIYSYERNHYPLDVYKRQIQIILSSSGSIFQAAGDTRSLFVCGVFSSVLNVTGILLGICLLYTSAWGSYDN